MIEMLMDTMRLHTYTEALFNEAARDIDFVNPVFWDSLIGEQSDRYRLLRPAMRDILDRTLTSRDLQDILTFSRTGPGRKYVAFKYVRSNAVHDACQAMLTNRIAAFEDYVAEKNSTLSDANRCTGLHTGEFFTIAFKDTVHFSRTTTSEIATNNFMQKVDTTRYDVTWPDNCTCVRALVYSSVDADQPLLDICYTHRIYEVGDGYYMVHVTNDLYDQIEILRVQEKR